VTCFAVSVAKSGTRISHVKLLIVRIHEDRNEVVVVSGAFCVSSWSLAAPLSVELLSLSIFLLLIRAALSSFFALLSLVASTPPVAFLVAFSLVAALFITLPPIIPTPAFAPSASFVFLALVALSTLAGLPGGMKLLVITLFVALPPGIRLTLFLLLSTKSAPGALLPSIAPAPLVAFLLSDATLPVALPPVETSPVFALSPPFVSLAPVAPSLLRGMKLFVTTLFVTLPPVEPMFITPAPLFALSLSAALLAPTALSPLIA